MRSPVLLSCICRSPQSNVQLMHHAMLEGCTADTVQMGGRRSRETGQVMVYLCWYARDERVRQERRERGLGVGERRVRREDTNHSDVFQALVGYICDGDQVLWYLMSRTTPYRKATFLPLYSSHHSPHLFTPHYTPTTSSTSRSPPTLR
jgi:hypothetical protein